jgi:hypothetical protein
MTWKEKAEMYADAASGMSSQHKGGYYIGMCQAVFRARSHKVTTEDLGDRLRKDYVTLLRRKWKVGSFGYLDNIPEYFKAAGVRARVKILKQLAAKCRERAKREKAK